MASDGIFVDTWAWLVLSNRRDPAFEEVSQVRKSSLREGSKWITTDYVLDETMTRIFSALPFSSAKRFIEGIFEAANLSLLDIEHVTPQRFSAGWRLRIRYHDKPRISFTDLTSFVVMHELGLRRVLSGDAHFEQVGMGFVRIPKHLP